MIRYIRTEQLTDNNQTLRYNTTGSGIHHASIRYYQVDPEVPVEYRASNTDYLGSGWSRGHMAAAANHAHDQQEMDETFYLSNIVPQVLSNNIG